MIPLLVQLRAAPTLGKTSGNFFFGDMVSVGSTSTSTPNIGQLNNDLHVSFDLAGFTGFTAFRSYKHETSGGNPAIFTMNAEL
jgi:hypothetical protein